MFGSRTQDCVAPALHSILGYYILSRWDWSKTPFLLSKVCVAGNSNFKAKTQFFA